MSARRTALLPASLVGFVAGSLVVGAVVALAGCVPTEQAAAPVRSASASGSPTPTPSGSAGPELPTAQPVPDASEPGEPVTIGCDQLVTSDEMYEYNANFGLDSAFTPDPGSVAGQAVAASGVACRWTNQTSGETIDVAVAHLGDRDLSARKDEIASSSTPVSDFGPAGYFDAGDITGVAQVFSGPYWVTATSVTFFEPADAAPIVAAALAALP